MAAAFRGLAIPEIGGNSESGAQQIIGLTVL